MVLLPELCIFAARLSSKFLSWLAINRICFVTHEVLKEIMRLNFTHDDNLDLPIVNQLLLSNGELSDSNIIESLVVAPNDVNEQCYEYMLYLIP